MANYPPSLSNRICCFERPRLLKQKACLSCFIVSRGPGTMENGASSAPPAGPSAPPRTQLCSPAGLRLFVTRCCAQLASGLRWRPAVSCPPWLLIIRLSEGSLAPQEMGRGKTSYSHSCAKITSEVRILGKGPQEASSQYEIEGGKVM